jgi:hypothetical protein
MFCERSLPRPLVICGLLIIQATAEPPELVFARQPMSSPASEWCMSTAIDGFGNVVAAGWLTDPEGTNYYQDGYIASYSRTGAERWTYVVGNQMDSAEVSSVAVDAAGAVYATGHFTGNVDFDNGEDSFVLYSGPDSAPFILKINASGNFVWARSLTIAGGAGFGLSIALDAAGSIYVGGLFAGTLDADPGPGTATLPSAGGYDGFLVKLDSTGNHLWSRSFGGVGAYERVTSVAVSPVGKVVVGGEFVNAANLDSVSLEWPVVSRGSSDFFLVSIGPGGDIEWAWAMGGTGEDTLHAIAMDNGGNIHAVGGFYATVDFDPGDDEVLATSAQWRDGYLLTLDAAGSYVNSAFFSNVSQALAAAVAVDGYGNIYVAGEFGGDLMISYSDGFNVLSGRGLYLAKLSRTSRVWAYGNPTNYGRLMDIAVDDAGAIVLAGQFWEELDTRFGAGDPVLITAAGEADAFLLSYKQVSAGEGVPFADPRLEAAVRQALAFPDGPIPFETLAGLARLNAAGRGIRALSGIEHATGLEFLDLSYNNIEDLTDLQDVLGAGDALLLFGNPLAPTALCTTVPAMEERGIRVGFERTCATVSTGRLSGYVRSDGIPVTCAGVIVTQGDARMGAAVVDDAGYYEINDLAQGVEYTLRFEAPSFLPAVATHTLTSRDDELSVELIPDSATLQISGIARELGVKDHAWPVPVARVTASVGASVVGQTITCASGFFALSGLDLTKQAAVTLTISALGYVDTVVEVLLKDAFVEVSMEKLNLPGSVVGLVVNPGQTPAAAAQVVVQQTPAGFSAVRTTTGDGGYSVSNVPAGMYEVRAVMAGVGAGLNNGQVQQSLATIDVELLRDLREDCVPPAAPAGVTASDGTDSAAVIVAWDSLGPGIEYRVLRANTPNPNAAVPLTDWIVTTTFSDTTAVAPTTVSSGCAGTTVTFTTHHYWVRAREVGAECESAPGGGDGGFRGEAKAWAAAASGCAPLLASLVVLGLVGGRRRARGR